MVKALVVDDSSTVRNMVLRMLDRFGFCGIGASNGQEALEALTLHRDFDLALVDWNMPIMNGIDFVRHARAEPEFDHMKIVMVTTETEMRQVMLALDAGVNEYIMKPFTKEIVGEKLAMLGLPVPPNQFEV